MRAPVWQTAALPSQATLNRSVSSSQSTRHLDDAQTVARRFTFRPQLVAGAAEERRVPGRTRPRERLFVHESDHQHFAGVASWTTAGIKPPSFEKSISTSNFRVPTANGVQRKRPCGMSPAGPRMVRVSKCLVHRAHKYRPAGAGMMVVPVMVQRRRHSQRDYRWPSARVNCQLPTSNFQRSRNGL